MSCSPMADGVGSDQPTDEQVLYGQLGAFPPGMPALEVLRDDLVERPRLGATSLVRAGRRRSAVRVESASRGKPSDRGVYVGTWGGRHT